MFPDFNTLETITQGLTESGKLFNKQRHESESRLAITKIFLYAYFALIAFAFIFSAFYNFVAAYLNSLLNVGIDVPGKATLITYIDVTNTVSIVTTTLGSGLGFMIGYYFKSKSED